MSWPIGIGGTFKGVYNLFDKSLRLFNASKTKIEKETIQIENIQDKELDEIIGEEYAQTLRHDVEVITEVYGEFNEHEYG